MGIVHKHHLLKSPGDLPRAVGRLLVGDHDVIGQVDAHCRKRSRIHASLRTGVIQISVACFFAGRHMDSPFTFLSAAPLTLSFFTTIVLFSSASASYM